MQVLVIHNTECFLVVALLPIIFAFFNVVLWLFYILNFGCTSLGLFCFVCRRLLFKIAFTLLVSRGGCLLWAWVL
jgi:hypothetical protein